MPKRFLCVVWTLCLTALLFSSCQSVLPPTDTNDTQPSATVSESALPDPLPEPPLPEPEPMAQPYSPVLSAELPTVCITTLDGSEITGDRLNAEYFDCTVSVVNCEAEYAFEEVSAEVKVRGNYTATYPKKPYRIKFTKKRNMLGLNHGAKCKSWVLLADYKDPSMLRNATANYLGQLMFSDSGYYCTDFRPVEVNVNGVYRGVYLLIEQQQLNPNRINIPEAEQDYTGYDVGYLLEFDWYYRESPELERFAMSYGCSKLTTRSNEQKSISSSGYSIKSNVYSAEQRDTIKKYMDSVFKIAYQAVYNGAYYALDENFNLFPASSSATEEVVRAVIDVDSLVNMYIFHEICCDRDYASSSFYMSVDLSQGADRRLTFQAPWDWDSALGIMPDPAADMPFVCEYNWREQVNPWLVLFVREDWFQELVSQRWEELKELNVKTRLTDMIDAYTTLYKENYARNFAKWKNCMGKKVDANVDDALLSFTTQADAAAHLSDWLVRRLDFLDRLFERSD